MGAKLRANPDLGMDQFSDLETVVYDRAQPTSSVKGQLVNIFHFANLCNFSTLSSYRSPKTARHNILICYCCHNEEPQAGWLKQQKFVFLQFWRLEVQDQDVGRVGFFSGRPLWLVLWPSPHCVFHMTVHPSVCIVCALISSFYKDTSHIGSGPTLISSSNFITSLRALSPNTVTF